MICSSSFLASAGQTAIKSQTSQPQATLEEWLEKWNKRQKKTKAMSGKSAPQPTYTLPPGLPPLQQLPPSLLPPPPSGYPELPRVEWGWCSPPPPTGEAKQRPALPWHLIASLLPQLAPVADLGEGICCITISFEWEKAHLALHPFLNTYEWYWSANDRHHHPKCHIAL